MASSPCNIPADVSRTSIGYRTAMARKIQNFRAAFAPLGIALGGVALGSITLSGPALAADFATKAPLYKAPPMTSYSWTGWYIGVNAGYGVGQNQGTATFPTAVETFNAMPGGGFGGGQLGYNYQIGSIVLGAETDIQGSGIADTRTCLLTCTNGTSALIDQKLTWFGTTRARLGWATGPVLTYVTGGAAYGGVETGLTVPGAALTTTTTKSGWTWGTGVEAALGGNWTAKAEYLYIDLGSSSVSVAGPAMFTTKNQEQLFRGGINYRFGPDQTAGIGPVANWAGFFVGGTVGYGIGRNDSTYSIPAIASEAFDLSPRGFDGGGIIGYNWQFGRWVLGLETDIQGTALGNSSYLTCVATCSTALATVLDQTQSWFGTTRGRLGYGVGPALFYVTGGAAYGDVKDSITQTAAGTTIAQSFTHTKSGYAVGGGIENKLDIFGLLGPNWTARTEYLYIDLGSVSDTFVNPGVGGAAAQTLTSNLHEQIWRTVISYKFGG